MDRPCSFCLCVCTYKRPALLVRLLEDVARQTVQPAEVVIVDGDPGSGEVPRALKDARLPGAWALRYVPSNHGNLAYQRYLGWRVAKETECSVLLYLDDDLRIEQPDAIEKTVAPVSDPGGDVVGVTAVIHMGDLGSIAASDPALAERSRGMNGGKDTFIIRWFGASRGVPPGGLSATGNRRMPSLDGQEYAPVQWLRGGVMAYRITAISRECFTDSLFALTHIGCGLGEDTLFSRLAAMSGQLVYAAQATFLHPHADMPVAYPTKALRLGYATAYSRRLLNDHYRTPNPPRWSDRFALLKSYAGNTARNWACALLAPRRHRFAFAWGYTKGALRGLLQAPTAKNLTPEINWWDDAETALARTSRINHG